MVRPLRIICAGAYYHVISRGNMEHFIFPEEENKKCFIDFLGKGTEKYRVEVYAYCVMGNHYHLLIQTKEANLPDFMHFLGSSYASYLAKREWKGHIFAGRYKAICVEKEEYFLTLQRYIHLNPVKAGLVERPEHFPWSSYIYFISDLGAPKWLNSTWMQEYFGTEEQCCRKSYREFMEEGIVSEYVYPWDKVVAQSILGSEDFVKKILENQPVPRSDEVAGRGVLLRQFTMEQIMMGICDVFGISDLKGIARGGSDVVRNARQLFIYLAKEYTTSTNRKIGEITGNPGPYAIANQYTRIRRLLREDAAIRREFNQNVDEILMHIEVCST
jgi:putative transposase